MGTDDLHSRLAELPGVLKCTVTDDTVALFLRPEVDPRLLKARAQVACAELGESRPLIVVGGLPDPAAASTAVRRTSLGARTRKATPISIIVGSLFVLSAVALMPADSDRPFPPRVDAPPSAAPEASAPPAVTVLVPAEPPASGLVRSSLTRAAPTAVQPAPARLTSGRAVRNLTSQLLLSARTATSGVVAALADATATAITPESVAFRPGLPPRTATSPAAPDSEVQAAVPAPTETSVAAATEPAIRDTATPVAKRSPTPEALVSGTTDPAVSSSRTQPRRRSVPSTREETPAPRTERRSPTRESEAPAKPPKTAQRPEGGHARGAEASERAPKADHSARSEKPGERGKPH